MKISEDYEMAAYLTLSNAFGQFEHLLMDATTAIHEIGYGTTELNRFRYEETDE